jgi:hypothetical protein
VRQMGPTGWLGILPCQLWWRGHVELGLSGCWEMNWCIYWIDGTHLNDGDPFQRLLWLFLKFIVKCDWLGREDVDERLNKGVLCLT